VAVPYLVNGESEWPWRSLTTSSVGYPITTAGFLVPIAVLSPNQKALSLITITPYHCSRPFRSCVQANINVPGHKVKAQSIKGSGSCSATSLQRRRRQGMSCSYFHQTQFFQTKNVPKVQNRLALGKLAFDTPQTYNSLGERTLFSFQRVRHWDGSGCPCPLKVKQINEIRKINYKNTHSTKTLNYL